MENDIKSFKEIQAELLKPIAYKFRLQSIKYGKATVVSYIDSRQLQDRLDEVVGAENWQVRYEEIKGTLFASIGIMTDNGWVWKSDCGTESNVEKEKGEASDSFKRAGVMWGVGRFLYSLPILELKTAKHTPNGGKEKEYPADDKGKILWSKEDLNKYCESLTSNKKKQVNPPNSATVEKPELTPSHKNWNEVAKWLAGKDGLVFDHIDTIREKYILSEDNSKKLSGDASLIRAKGDHKSVEVPEETLIAIKEATDLPTLARIYNECTDLHTSKDFIQAYADKQKELAKLGKAA